MSETNTERDTNTMNPPIQIHGTVSRADCTPECGIQTKGQTSEKIEHGFAIYSTCLNNHPVTVLLNVETDAECKALALLVEQLQAGRRAVEVARDFERFTDPASADYDFAFLQKLRSIRPDWFTQH